MAKRRAAQAAHAQLEARAERDRSSQQQIGDMRRLFMVGSVIAVASMVVGLIGFTTYRWCVLSLVPHLPLRSLRHCMFAHSSDAALVCHHPCRYSAWRRRQRYQQLRTPAAGQWDASAVGALEDDDEDHGRSVALTDIQRLIRAQQQSAD